MLGPHASHNHMQCQQGSVTTPLPAAAKPVRPLKSSSPCRRSAQSCSRTSAQCPWECPAGKGRNQTWSTSVDNPATQHASASMPCAQLPCARNGQQLPTAARHTTPQCPASGPHLQREQADGQLAVHHPLLRLAVWLAAVVDEAPQVALQVCRPGRQAGTVSSMRSTSSCSSARSSARSRAHTSPQPCCASASSNGRHQASSLPHPARRVNHFSIADVHEVVVALPRLNEVLLAAAAWAKPQTTLTMRPALCVCVDGWLPIAAACSARHADTVAGRHAAVHDITAGVAMLLCMMTSRLASPCSNACHHGWCKLKTKSAPAQVLLLLQNLADVLNHKLARLDVLRRKQAKALGTRALLRVGMMTSQRQDWDDQTKVGWDDHTKAELSRTASAVQDDLPTSSGQRSAPQPAATTPAYRSKLRQRDADTMACSAANAA